MSRRKGQAAMEFLTTYGWAIMVVLVSIGALAYFGVLNPGKYLPDKCVFTTGVSCKDFIIQQGTGSRLEARFTLVNNLGDGMTIAQNNITVTYKTTTQACGPNADGTWGASTTRTISAGDQLGFNCIFAAGSSPGAGQNAKLSASINYTLTQGVYGKHAAGDLSSTVQG
jgi:uncharacterized protein (UPF0333 family)